MNHWDADHPKTTPVWALEAMMAQHTGQESQQIADHPMEESDDMKPSGLDMNQHAQRSLPLGLPP